jgi:hypothetical protein
MRCSILALVALIACQEKKSDPPPPSPPHDGVTLIQPGAAPLHLLRYHLRKGTRTRSELVFDLDLKNDGQGSPMPTLVVALETVVDDVLADGTAKLLITVVETSVRERPGTEATSSLERDEAAAMQGVVIAQTLATDGKISGARVQLPAALSDKPHVQLDRLSQGLEHMAMRLPLEPVGIGATWRTREGLPEGGIRAISETTYTLTSLTGDTLAYTGAGRAMAAPQTLEQDGLKVEVTSARGHAEAMGTIDLSRYVLDVTSTTMFTTAMNVIAPEGTPGAGPSTIDVTVAIRMTPAVPAARAPAAPPDEAARSAASPAARGAGSDQGAHRAP